MTQDTLAPRARDRGLVVRNLDGEVLIYDLEGDRAHCLDPTAGLVWKACEGDTSISELVQLLRVEVNPEADETTVWGVLLQLHKDGLLAENVSRPLHERGMTRRQMMQRVGIAAAAAGVTTLVIPAVGAHATPTCGTGCTGGQICNACPSGASPATLCCASGSVCCKAATGNTSVCCTCACSTTGQRCPSGC